MIVSRRRGSALKRARTSNFNPLIVEIVFRGLKTRKALSPFRLNEEEDVQSPTSGSPSPVSIEESVKSPK